MKGELLISTSKARLSSSGSTSARQTALAMPCQEIPTAPAWHAWAAFPLTHPGPSNPVPRLTYNQSKAKL